MYSQIAVSTGITQNPGNQTRWPQIAFPSSFHVTDAAGPDNIFGNTVPDGHHLLLCQYLFESYVNIYKDNDSWLTLGIGTQRLHFDNC